MATNTSLVFGYRLAPFGIRPDGIRTRPQLQSAEAQDLLVDLQRFLSGLLVAAALAAWERPGWRLWAAGVVVAGTAGANLAVEREAYVLTTMHADYAIEADAGGARSLRVNGQNASREDGAGTGHPYVEWIEDRVYVSAAPTRQAAASSPPDTSIVVARSSTATAWCRDTVG